MARHLPQNDAGASDPAPVPALSPAGGAGRSNRPDGPDGSDGPNGSDGAPVRWLVSARYDMVFFIGSCVITWLFLGLYHLLGHVGLAPDGASVLITYFVFTALFDHPHIFQTFSRTHGDDAEFRRHRRTHTWGLAALIAAGFVISAAGWSPQLIVFAAIFGQWHIMRQHWGFIRIYKRRNDDLARWDNLVDGAVFYLGMAAFFLYDYTGNPRETVIYGALKAPFPNLPDLLVDAVWYGFCVALAIYAARQLWRVRRGRRLNTPKLLFMTAALSTHGLVFFFTATPFLVAEALETAYHNVQYQGFIAHYQKRRFAVRGLAGRWLLWAMVYGAIVGVIEIVALYWPSCSWLFVPFAMIVIYHYYVDGKIWRMSTAPELAQALGASRSSKPLRA